VVVPRVTFVGLQSISGNAHVRGLHEHPRILRCIAVRRVSRSGLKPADPEDAADQGLENPSRDVGEG
jgi:hypothetical protein